MQITNFNTMPNGSFGIDFPDLDSDNTLITVFADSSLLDDDSVLNPLRAAYPKSKFAGCSTSGEIFQSTVNDNTVSVAVAKFEKTNLQCSTAEVTNMSDSRAAGQTLANNLKADDLTAIFILSDGLNVNGTQLVNGIKANVSEGVIITGGLAGDGARFERTWILKDRIPTQNFVSAIGFYGKNINIKSGSRGGWDVFGLERKVTKSKDNILFELDDKPALALYKTYLGELANELPSSGLLFPLAIRENEDDQNQIVRTILAIDEKNQSLTFAGDIPEGFLAQLMKANFENLIDGASSAAEQAKLSNSKENTLAIAISCVGRRLVLKERTEEELESVLDVFSQNTKLVGFYSYGEIAPHAITQDCSLHNQTMTLTAITEK